MDRARVQQVGERRGARVPEGVGIDRRQQRREVEHLRIHVYVQYMCSS